MLSLRVFTYSLLASAMLLTGMSVAHAQGGCSDGQREGFLTNPNIAGCAGGWTTPGILACQPSTLSPSCGRNAGDDSSNPAGTNCNVEDLCAPGWRVCRSADEVQASGGGGCAGAAPAGTALFFATRQSSNGCNQCATGTSTAACCNGSTCCGGCLQTCDTANDLYGCGSLGPLVGTTSCNPLARASGNLCGGLPSPWDCGTDSTEEALHVVKPGSDAGGVLCCRLPFQPRFQYAAKFICGRNDQDVHRVLPGLYATAVNIHNPSAKNVTFRKKIALTYPPAAQIAGEVSGFIYHEIKGDEALAVDCEEIPTEFFGGPVAPYVKGYLVIESDRSIDVTAVYTASPMTPGTKPEAASEDVEHVPERKL